MNSIIQLKDTVAREFGETTKKIMSNKKNGLIFLIAAAVLASGVILIFNNYNWYSETIVRIDSVKNLLSHEVNTARGSEKYYDQTLAGTAMNGGHKGKTVYLHSTFSSSGVYDDEYKAGDEVFVQINSENGRGLEGVVTGLKRDKFAAILIAVFVLLILAAAKRKGLFSIVSLIINIVVFYYALNLYTAGYNMLRLSIIMAAFFTSISLLIIAGFQKKTFAAILSALISICITMMLFKIVMLFTDGVDYAFMEYITNPNDLPEIFMSQMLLGGLGAIMDVSITEAAAINELVLKNNEISRRDLIKSGREVGHDIMGTMINVMLFTYICGSIPLIILKMNSEIRLSTIISLHIPMELYRFFVGSIGILLTIPISLMVSVFLFKRKGRSV